MNVKLSGRRVARPGVGVVARVEHRRYGLTITAGTEGYIEGVHGSDRTILVRWHTPDCALIEWPKDSGKLIPALNVPYTQDEAPTFLLVREHRERRTGWGTKPYYYQLVVR